MFKKLADVEKKFEKLSSDLQAPGVTDDPASYRKLMKEYAELEKIVVVFRRYKLVQKNIEENKALLGSEKDEEMRKLIRSDLSDLDKELIALESELKEQLIPKDPNDEKNIVLEIRAGAGGDEASLFAEELFRAYSLFAAHKGWKVTLVSASLGNVGGFKEVIAMIQGEKVFSFLKYESGVHRVQRVPKTETQGRIHTSTVTVAVLPEADEVDVHINPADLRFDVMRASGAGGQSVNRTESAVRVTHIPTGIFVACQEAKSQLDNKQRAMQILYAKLLAIEEEKSRKEASDARLSQIGTGDRSERIRTYNFPQSRITDHRIGFTTHQLSEVMDGHFEIVVDPVMTHFRAEALKSQQSAV